MVWKVVVVGMGNVGVIVVYYLVVGGFIDDFVLIDLCEEKVVVDVVDFEDVMVNLEYYINIFVNDYEVLVDVDVVVFVFGNIKF